MVTFLFHTIMVQILRSNFAHTANMKSQPDALIRNENKPTQWNTHIQAHTHTYTHMHLLKNTHTKLARKKKILRLPLTENRRWHRIKDTDATASVQNQYSHVVRPQGTFRYNLFCALIMTFSILYFLFGSNISYGYRSTSAMLPTLQWALRPRKVRRQF